jgi:hypothetical protein
VKHLSWVCHKSNEAQLAAKISMSNVYSAEHQRWEHLIIFDESGFSLSGIMKSPDCWTVNRT